MQILFVGPLPEPITGQSLACRVLLEELRTTHEVEVINLSKDNFKQGINSAGRIAVVFRIIADVLMKKASADAIYLTISESAAGNLKDILIYLVCGGRLSRMVIHLYGGAGLRQTMFAKWNPLRWVNRFFWRRVGGVVVEGPSQIPTLLNAVPLERVHVVANFAEDNLFTDLEEIERRFSDDGPLKVLFLSNLLPGKGHVELIEAFLSLEPRVREAIQLDLAGGFETAAQKRDLLARIATVPQIRYHGTVHGELRKQLFHRAHVFCLPTYYPYEGQPFSILEAYAAGCAVITTDHSGIRDVFTDGINGYEVKKQSVVAVKNALHTACADRIRLRAIAETNLGTALRQYRVATFKTTLTGIINTVATA